MKMLRKNDTSFSALHAIAFKNYGVKFYDFDPDTIRMEFTEMGATELVISKLNAVACFMSNDFFYHYFATFENISRTMNHHFPMCGTMTPLSTKEIAWALAEASLNLPADEKPKISGEIHAYITAVMKTEGSLRCPALIKSHIPDCTYDYVSEDTTDEQRKEQASYEREIIEYVEYMLKKTQSELDSLK